MHYNLTTAISQPYMTFTRTKEDFTCEHCGAEAKGNGYTNHCPKCLWSKHVDIDPGDRTAECDGLMEPTGVLVGGGEYALLHQCIRCNFERKNKVAKSDDFDEVVKLSRTA